MPYNALGVTSKTQRHMREGWPSENTYLWLLTAQVQLGKRIPVQPKVDLNGGLFL